MIPTEQFIRRLEALKPGDLGLLRKHAGLPLDESLSGFDLFTGLWWPLRQRSQQAPRREVAWLIAKLYGLYPIPHANDATLATQLGGQPLDERRQQRFDHLLSLPLAQLEPALQWALGVIADHTNRLDWVRLTDQVSRWEREETRLKWAREYLRLP